jgi:[ribosomal protein S5]-alanine N-acetyltransferase
MQTLTTPRLLLREANDVDAAFIATLMNDPGYLSMIGDRGVRTAEDAAKYLRSALIYIYGPAGLGFNIVQLHSGTCIGICGLVKRDTLQDVDLGYALVAAHCGLGYATEAAAATLAHAQGTLGLQRVVAITDPGNTASARVLQKIGMRFEKVFTLPPWDGDAALYATAP